MNGKHFRELGTAVAKLLVTGDFAHSFSKSYSHDPSGLGDLDNKQIIPPAW